MASLLERLRRREAPQQSERSTSLSFQDWVNLFSYNGVNYPILNTSLGTGPIDEPDQNLPGYSLLMKQCPPAFAAQTVRAMVLSQARFIWRRQRGGTPGRTFGNQSLRLLERPWPNGTTGELISIMEWHAGLAGNAFVHRQPNRLRVLRPDWVSIVHGSTRSADDDRFMPFRSDAELIGYIYEPGGINSGNGQELLDPREVAHWSPIPDPETPWRGMSWFTPAVREAMGDKAVTHHKLKFFENGATPNLVIKGIPATTKDQFNDAVDMIEDTHNGVENAYKTLYLTSGADAEVIGSNLSEIDLKAVQGGFETRVALLSRVPATVLSISEGMQGSALNAGNYSQARRSFADSWVYPMLQDLSAALGSIVPSPGGAELWFDTSEMPFLRQDETDVVTIQQTKASTINQLITNGWEPSSAIAAVENEDLTQLQHTGLLSVQLQPPGTTADGQPPSGPEADPPED